jgi:hypothetical protein
MSLRSISIPRCWCERSRCKELAQESLAAFAYPYPDATIEQVRSGLPYRTSFLGRIADGLESVGMPSDWVDSSSLPDRQRMTRSANSGPLTVRGRASEKGVGKSHWPKSRRTAEMGGERTPPGVKLRAEGLVKVALWQGVEVADDLWERII